MLCAVLMEAKDTRPRVRVLEKKKKEKKGGGGGGWIDR